MVVALYLCPKHVRQVFCNAEYSYNDVERPARHGEQDMNDGGYPHGCEIIAGGHPTMLGRRSGENSRVEKSVTYI